MKTIFIDSHKTIEEHYTVIFQELSDLKTSITFNRITSKLVYILYIPSLVNCVSFIKIGLVVLPYQQFQVLKSTIIQSE